MTTHSQTQVKQTKIGVNKMTVNESEMKQRSLVKTGDTSSEIAYTD